MNSDLYKLGYEQTLAALGVDREKVAARPPAIIGKVFRGARGLLRGRPKLPSTAQTEAAAAQLGSTPSLIERGQSFVVPKAPPPKPLDPIPTLPGRSAAPAPPPHPSQFFGGHKAPPPLPPEAIRSSRGMTQRAPVDMTQHAQLLPEGRTLGEWWKGLPGWQRGAMTLGGLGGGAYLARGMLSNSAPQGPEQYYGDMYGQQYPM